MKSLFAHTRPEISLNAEETGLIISEKAETRKPVRSHCSN